MNGIFSLGFALPGECSYRSFNIEITGPASSGRTAFLLRQLKGRYVDPAAAEGLDFAAIKRGNCVLNIFDRGTAGQHNRRSYSYASGVMTADGTEGRDDEFDGVFFFIDSSDHGRIPLARRLLSQLIFERASRRPPILVVATKQDVRGALAPSELAVRLDIEEMLGAFQDQAWDYGIIGVSSCTGLGCGEALDWISEAVWQHQSFCYCVPFNNLCYSLYNFGVLLFNC